MIVHLLRRVWRVSYYAFGCNANPRTLVILRESDLAVNVNSEPNSSESQNQSCNGGPMLRFHSFNRRPYFADGTGVWRTIHGWWHLTNEVDWMVIPQLSQGNSNFATHILMWSWLRASALFIELGVRLTKEPRRQGRARQRKPCREHEKPDAHHDDKREPVGAPQVSRCRASGQPIVTAGCALRARSAPSILRLKRR